MALLLRVILIFYVSSLILDNGEGCCCTHRFFNEFCGCNIFGCNCDFNGDGMCWYKRMWDWFVFQSRPERCWRSDEPACPVSKVFDIFSCLIIKDVYIVPKQKLTIIMIYYFSWILQMNLH